VTEVNYKAYLNSEMRAPDLGWPDVNSVTFAASSGKAKANFVRASRESGECQTFTDVRVYRMPQYDHLQKLAAAHGPLGTCFTQDFMDTLLPAPDQT
jgi:hypothetical protein